MELLVVLLSLAAWVIVRVGSVILWGVHTRQEGQP
jgi:hypothetical protein